MLKHVPGQVVGIELVHMTIMDRAEELANRNVQGVRLPPGVSGTIFNYDPLLSTSGGLTLSIKDVVDDQITDEQRAELWEIGAQAIEDAIIEYQDLWVAGLLQDAMEGTNYFDRFEQ